MTTAIRSTVAEYLEPPRPKFTAFPPSRVTQRILSKQLREPWLPTIRDASPTRSSQSDVDDEGSSSTTLPPDSPSRGYEPGSGPPGDGSLPNPETITTETIDSHMYTASDPPLDLFIRTSGVERLSDFLLWQAHQDTQIYFLKCFWPEFDLKHFIPVLLEWQWTHKQKERDERPLKRKRTGTKGRLQE
jgi:ditrans,polycis-polyprenyl diphosphate synthase